MKAPVTASELCQFVHCCGWMFVCTLDFHNTVRPSHKISENAYPNAKKQNKKKLKDIAPHTLSWSTKIVDALTSIKDILRTAKRSAFRKQHQVEYMYTDATKVIWALAVTVANKDDLGKPIEQQQHEALQILPKTLTGSQRNWTTYDKKSYTIVQAFGRFDYLLQRSKLTHVLTDYKRLLFEFAPQALISKSLLLMISKVHRWAINLSRFQFYINRIEVVDNVLSDILRRWSKGRRTSCARSAFIAARHQDIVLEAATTTAVSIENIQKKQLFKSETGINLQCEGGIMYHNH